MNNWSQIRLLWDWQCTLFIQHCKSLASLKQCLGTDDIKSLCSHWLIWKAEFCSASNLVQDISALHAIQFSSVFRCNALLDTADSNASSLYDQFTATHLKFMQGYRALCPFWLTSLSMKGKNPTSSCTAQGTRASMKSCASSEKRLACYPLKCSPTFAWREKTQLLWGTE